MVASLRKFKVTLILGNITPLLVTQPSAVRVGSIRNSGRNVIGDMLNQIPLGDIRIEGGAPADDNAKLGVLTPDRQRVGG